MQKLLHLFLNFLGFMIIFVLIIGLVFAYARHIEPYATKKKEVTILSPHVGNAAGLTICLFTDTHFSEWYTPEHFIKAVSAINDAKPDLVLFLGDLIDNYKAYEGDTAKISEVLAQIEAPLGKFAVFGNHDYGGGANQTYIKIMEAGGFKVLIDEMVHLEENGMRIYGIDDVLIGNGTPEIASAAEVAYFNIVMCHEPDVANEILDWPIDLMVSGHTHGGQIRLPFITKDFLPPKGKTYVKGMYQFENDRKTTLYVNPGLGMTKLPLRLFSNPELTFVHIAESE